MSSLPLIDISGLLAHSGSEGAIAAEIDRACRTQGFFLVHGHGVSDGLMSELDALARRFFALDEAAKAEVEMARSGRAWRGWFPVGGELTSGVPDLKEGYYFGAELPADDPRVLSGEPLHGPNPFPRSVPQLRKVVLDFLDAMTQLGHELMRGIAIGLGLDPEHFRRDLTADPTILFRIFHYPPVPAGTVTEGWGVAEHTDYGLLTILWQDASGGLEVHTPSGWVAADPIPGTLVCNLGDMLERMTGGRYRSTPHRVRPQTGSTGIGRLSFPFFFDPSWDAVVTGLDLAGEPPAGSRTRWDGADPLAFDGTYGEYLTAKVAKVFPELFEATID